MDYQLIHHTAVGVTDLDRSREFSPSLLALKEPSRPPFGFPGAWYELPNGQQVHLIVWPNPTLRAKGLETRDVHIALRVESFREAVQYFFGKGYRQDSADEFSRIIISPKPIAGFP